MKKMQKKTSLIIAIAVLTVIVLAIAAVIVIPKLSDSDSSSSSFEVWKQQPFIYSSSEEVYTSHHTPFTTEIKNLTAVIEAESIETGKSLGIKGAYASEGEIPTVIIAYDTPEGKLNFLVCKFKDDKLYKAEIETEWTSLSESNNVFLAKGTDIVVLREGISAELGRQIVYDFGDGRYCAVKDNNFEGGKPDEMSQVLEEYNASATELNVFTDIAVTSDVDKYLEGALEISLAD